MASLRARSLPAAAAALALALLACDAADLRRWAGAPQGTLRAGLGLPMSEVQRRSTLALHKLPSLGLPSGSYADGNAWFDFELVGSGLRFPGRSMYNLDYAGPAETVTAINVFVGTEQTWAPFARSLAQAAGQLEADAWEPHAAESGPTLRAFAAQADGPAASTSSGVVATFEWRKAEAVLRLSAHRGWDRPRFWYSLDVIGKQAEGTQIWKPGQRWLDEFPAYASAQYVCRQHVLGRSGERRKEIDWTMYATADAPASVVAFYGAAQGAPAEPGATSLSLAGRDARKRLSVHPVAGSYPACDVKPPAWAQTVILVSEATL